jgi:hypothetical protein
MASIRSAMARLAQRAVISNAVMHLSVALDLCSVTGVRHETFWFPVTCKNRREQPLEELSKVIGIGSVENRSACRMDGYFNSAILTCGRVKRHGSVKIALP